MAYQRIKKLWPNGMPNHLTGGLLNHYREANRHSTEAAYREVDREVYRKVNQQSLPSRPRFTETPALLQSASARSLSSGEKDQGEKITGKDHRKRSREKIWENEYIRKHLQVNANCRWLPICLMPHEDYRYCMKHAEALYEGSEEHKRT